jgi:hypothetical protein
MPNAGSMTYWYLQVPNLVVLAMVALLIVQLALMPVLSNHAGIMRLVGAITRPVMATVGFLTPRIVPQAGVIVCAVIWLMAVRTILFMAALAMGIRL